MEKGVKYMVAVSAEIDRIIESPSKKLTKEEALQILRSCGILNEENNVKNIYKKIILKETSDENGKE